MEKDPFDGRAVIAQVQSTNRKWNLLFKYWEDSDQIVAALGTRSVSFSCVSADDVFRRIEIEARIDGWNKDEAFSSIDPANLPQTKDVAFVYIQTPYTDRPSIDDEEYRLLRNYNKLWGGLNTMFGGNYKGKAKGQAAKLAEAQLAWDERHRGRNSGFRLHVNDERIIYLNQAADLKELLSKGSILNLRLNGCTLSKETISFDVSGKVDLEFE